MRKFLRLAAGLALLAGSVRAQAPHPTGPAYVLGTSQALVKQLETQQVAGVGQRATSTVALRVSATQILSGQVNYRDELGATGEYVVGEVAGAVGSSFRVRVQGGQVEGTIVLPATHQAYCYTANAAGRVLVTPVDINDILCVGYRRTASAPPAPATSARSTAVVALQSLPGGRGCVLLDTDGYELPAGSRWNGGKAYSAPAAGMSNANVQALWELVSEDFRPLSLNVTTDEGVFNTYPKTMRMRCVISPGSSSTIAPNTGGIAYIGSFKYNEDLPCWVFISTPKNQGEAASHEIGHSLGLLHDGRINPTEPYFGGQGDWAPIMGVGYYTTVTQWSKGEYANASNKEDDLAIMSSSTYNVGYRPDDHGDNATQATALAVSGTSLAGSGLIERATDQDFFSFSTGGGAVSLNVSTVNRYGNLKLLVRLFNSSGTQLGSYSTAGDANLNASVNATLAAGRYYLSVDGTGSGNPLVSGYSDYGSLGSYTIAGTAPAVVNAATVYRDCNYGGGSISLPVGDYTLADLTARGVRNDDISSVLVFSGYQVILYQEDNFQGQSVTLNINNTCLVFTPRNFGNWNDQTSSLRIRAVSASVATVYRDCNYSGASVSLPVGDYLLADLQAWGVRNDDISSIKVQGGYQITLYSDNNFQGQALRLTADNSCLVNNALNNGTWNDQVSSLRIRAVSVPVVAAAVATVYRDCNYEGGGVSLPVGNYTLADLQARGVRNDDISSLQVQNGYQVVLYCYDNFLGESLTIRGNNYCLADNALLFSRDSWNDQVSSIRVQLLGTAVQPVATAQPAAASSAALIADSTAPAVYPNPVTERLALSNAADLVGAELHIRSAEGRQVFSGRYTGQALEVAHLTPGLYWLTLSTGAQHWNLRFSKQ